MTTAYEIDSSPLFPQPDTHEWEKEEQVVVGVDSTGAPIKRKYRSCRLTSNHQLSYHAWSAWDDGSTHSVLLPAPGDRPDIWTTYNSVHIVVSHGVVARGRAVGGVEMIITKIDTS